MITAVVFLILVATVPLLGGSLTHLGEVRLKAWWTIVASLVIQVVLIEVLSDSFGGKTAAALHLSSYGLAFMFVWYNRHLVGMGVMVLGGVMNAAAIAANGGVMPARLEALETAGIISDSPTFENSAPVENARLAFLGDVFAIPEGVPFANVFSIGDILLVIGGGVTVHVIGRSRLGRHVPGATADPGRLPGAAGGVANDVRSNEPDSVDIERTLASLSAGLTAPDAAADRLDRVRALRQEWSESARGSDLSSRG